jgi:adenylate cyclase
LERRLAAILAADVVGYSRLMGEDETGTLERLKSLRRELVQPKIMERMGRIVKLMGDGLLAEFPSVVEAVGCAVDIQQGMAGKEADLPDERRIRLRIGVNLGDIIVEGSDIYGDGVNVAARLEGLAEPGGICISSKVYEEVRTKLSTVFEDLGEQEVKNIAEPVRVYRWTDAAADPMPGTAGAEDALPLPDKPSIAVLPFTNMSGDPEQEYFSDGITEDIITELTRFPSLFVIARNSSFAYKGQSVNVGKIGQELGVAYVVEGSVRKAGNRVRITAQLVEAESGNHLWAERYDRELEDIFAVQDEVVREIAAAVPGQLDAIAAQRARRRQVKNLTAYDYVLRGEWHLNQEYASPDAVPLFEKALEIDPQCARAYTWLADFHAYSVFRDGASIEEAARMARSLAERALQIDPADPAVQAIAAEAYYMVGEPDLARRHIEIAIKLNPNSYVVMRFAAYVFAALGDHEEGLRWLNRLSRHDPAVSSGDAHREGYFDLFYMARRYEDAIEAFRGWRNPQPHMYLELAAAFAQVDRIDDVRTTMAQFERIRPEGFDAVKVAHSQARTCARQEDADHWLEGYRKAGLDV